MKLLVLTSNPNRPSFRQRIGVHLEALMDEGIDSEVVRLPGGVFSRNRIFKKSGQFDAVFLHKKRLNPWAAVCLRRHCRRLIYDFDDAIMYSDKHPQRNSWKRQDSFKRTAKTADLVIAGNDYLAEHARPYCDDVHVLPTGLNVGEYSPQSALRDDGKIRLVWIGSASTLEYLRGIKPALEQVGRDHANVVLRIVCDEFFDLDNMQVEKCRWSLAEQARFLAESHIGLAPLPDDRFTRGKCGFKILQYAASGLAFVASGVGVNKKFAEDAGIGLLAEGHSEWAEKTGRLVCDGGIRARLGAAGREYVQQFDVKVIGRRLCSLIKGVV